MIKSAEHAPLNDKVKALAEICKSLLPFILHVYQTNILLEIKKEENVHEWNNEYLLL